MPKINSVRISEVNILGQVTNYNIQSWKIGSKPHFDSVAQVEKHPDVTAYYKECVIKSAQGVSDIYVEVRTTIGPFFFNYEGYNLKR